MMGVEFDPGAHGASVRRWKPYTTYKDSGVEWLGEVPEGWESKRLKYISTVNDETLGETTDSNFELLYVDISSVDSVSGIKNKEYMTFENAPSRARRKVRHGDIIISTVRTYLRAISPINNPEPNMIVSTGFAVIHPKKGIESQFAAYALRAPYFVDEVVANSVGVSYPAINASEMITFNIILPSLAEQRAIAAFLDRKTAHIDILISKKERLITLLQEKRAALISHTVTKGLDPDVPMKDSGVEWLGEIPAHWEIMDLKRIANVRYGLGQPPSELINGLPLIRATNIKRGQISDENMLFIDPDEVPEGRDAVLSEGEIIVVRSGAYTGDSAIIPLKYAGAIAGYDTVLTIKKGSNHYFAWQFLSTEIYDLEFGFYKLRAAQPHLNAEEIKETMVIVPLIDEQHAIAAFLDRETAKLDALISKIHKAIEKLQEYRTALISAAVTGKIDVRNENRN